jgi:predicted nucleic acid-binding Zn ribbon protein
MKKKGSSTEGAERNSPSRCGDILLGALKGMGLVGVIHHLALLRAWEQAIPLRIRERATVEAFREGRLYVCVEDPIWLHELHMLRHKLKVMLNKELGEPALEEIILRIGRAPCRSAPDTPKARAHKAPSVPSSGAEGRIKELLAPLEERPYRDALERLIHRWAARFI